MEQLIVYTQICGLSKSMLVPSTKVENTEEKGEDKYSLMAQLSLRF